MTNPFSKTLLVFCGAMMLCPSLLQAQTFSNNYWTTANYIAILGRHPDPGGWLFWTAQYGTGMTQTQFTDYQLSSGEYCGFFGLSADAPIHPPMRSF
jgi:hypothetical protein